MSPKSSNLQCKNTKKMIDAYVPLKAMLRIETEARMLLVSARLLLFVFVALSFDALGLYCIPEGGRRRRKTLPWSFLCFPGASL